MEEEIWVFCCGDQKFEHDFWKFVEENGISHSNELAGSPVSPEQFLTGFTLVASALSIAASLAKINEWRIAQRRKGRRGKIMIRTVKKRKSTSDIETEDDEYFEVIAKNIDELILKTGKIPRKKRSTKKKGKTHRE